jgi:hypothetical protein
MLLNILDIDSNSFGVQGSAAFAAAKNQKSVKKNLKSNSSALSMSRRKVGSTSTKTVQKNALAML